LLKKLPLLTVIEAPAGYGKTTFARKLCAEFPNFPLLEYNYPGTGGDIFFDNLSRLCADIHVPFAYTKEIFDWYRVWNSATTPFILFLDDFLQLKPEERVRNFLAYLLKNPLPKLHLIISTSTQLNLPIQDLLSSGSGKYLELNDLNLSLEEMKNLWQEEKIEWSKEDDETFNYFSGWPGGIALYLRYRKREISRTVYAKVLQDYVSQAINPLSKKINENHNLRQEKQILAEVEKLPKVLSDRLTSQLKKDPEYWIYLANEDKQTPDQAILLLQRAMALTETQGSNQLNVITRMAHNYSLLAEYRKLDALLLKGEKYLENSPLVDRFAWLYLKANRLRQLCHYEESEKLLNDLVAEKATGQASLNFQTRARVLLGLIEYQRGNYEQTRNYYRQAMLLAKSEFNEILVMELQIMSAFLEVWEGRDSITLPESITEIIDKQPKKTQPLMWLNLAFFWILGEQIDLSLTGEIISRIKELSFSLGWSYLNPLIIDVEARLKRYIGEYKEAFILHQQAVSGLEPDTFEYYHALLNQALTMLKQGKKEAANKLLQEIRERTEKNGSLGLCREAKVLLGEKENRLKD